MEDIDTDIDKYSVEDIYAILNLQDPSEYQVKDAANNIISQNALTRKLFCCHLLRRGER